VSQGGSKLSIVVRHEGAVGVLVLTGELVQDDGDEALRDEVRVLAADGHTRLVADLAGVSYVDSAGMGMIISMQKYLRDRGGDLRLARPPERIERVLTLMRLGSVLKTFRDESAAIASYN
jgi:anti-anti-sigma factor